MKHTKQILLVFPGLGKTYLALRKPGFADCDYGYYRAGFMKVQVERIATYNAQDSTVRDVMNHFSQVVMNIYAKEGYIVLTNEPALIPWLKQLDADVRMILPKEGVDMGKRVLEREKEHPVNAQWARTYNDNWQDWVKDWAAKAARYGIPVTYAEYLYEDWSDIEKWVTV